jgi:hypothetical protein
MISRAAGQSDQVRILDVGGTTEYWNIVPRSLLEQYRVRITIVNLPGARMLPPSPPFDFVAGDGCDLHDVTDNAFDIAHSNSTLEHVGDWSRMVAFASEIRRVAPVHFVQTPNFWFPVEPHCMTPFFHWLPRPTRAWLVQHFELGNWSRAESVDQAARLVESARIVNRSMFRALFPDSQIRTERFAGLPKSLIATRGWRDADQAPPGD